METECCAENAISSPNNNTVANYIGITTSNSTCITIITALTDKPIVKLILSKYKADTNCYIPHRSQRQS